MFPESIDKMSMPWLKPVKALLGRLGAKRSVFDRSDPGRSGTGPTRLGGRATIGGEPLPDSDPVPDQILWVVIPLIRHAIVSEIRVWLPRNLG